MRVTHVKPDGWVDTDEADRIQPSAVAELVHEVTLDESDLLILRGPQGDKGDAGPQGPQGLKGDAGAPGPGFMVTPTVPLPGPGATVSVGHGLGEVPSLVVCELVCTVADCGYAVGDVVQGPPLWNGSGVTWTLTLWKSAVFVGFKLPGGCSLSILRKDTGGAFIPAAAKWGFRFRVAR